MSAFEMGVGSELHTRFVSEVWQRVQMAENGMNEHYKRFRENEKLHRSYKVPTDKDVKSQTRKSNGQSDFESIIFPASYSFAMTAHTFYTSVFLQRNPIFQFEGRHGEGAMKELAMESMIEYQVKSGKMTAPLMIWLLDVLKFGMGIVGNYWTEEIDQIANVEQEEIIEDGVPTGKFRRKIVREPKTTYEGNKLFNVSPYNYLPDPRVPFLDPNAGEFVGRKFKLSWNEAKRREAKGIYFNLEEARKIAGTSDETRVGFERAEYLAPKSFHNRGLRTPKEGKSLDEMDAVELYWDLIPRDWGLGDSDHPEKWVFTMVGRKVIIGAEPLGLFSNKFPFHVLEKEVDGYKQGSRSIYEIAQPMNDTLSWLFNSHMYNKRASLNNQFVVDPQRIVMKDAQSRDPGKLIRLKPEAYGTDVRTALTQLQVADVTQLNIQDAQLVLAQMQQVLGVNQDVAGVTQGSSRRSATEFRGTTGFSTQRLATDTLWFSFTGFDSLATSLVSSTQQLFDAEMKVKVAGDNIRGLESVTVDPDRIAGYFDFVNVDGTQPIDRTQQALFMQQIIQGMLQIPGLAQEYRISDLFAYTVKLAGLRGVDRFKIQTRSDEDVIAEIERGNLVPANETGGGQNGGGGIGGLAESLGFAAGTNNSVAGLGGAT